MCIRDSLQDADLSALPAGEKAVLELVALRLLCAVAQPYIYSDLLDVLPPKRTDHDILCPGLYDISYQWYADLSIVPVRKEQSERSEMISQILFGELFEILEITDKCLYSSRRSWDKSGSPLLSA